MSNRRSFFLKNVPATALGLAAALKPGSASAAGASEPKPRAYFEFVTVRLQSGAQVSRLLAWFEKRALPLFEKHRVSAIGFFTVDVGPAIPSLLAIFSYAGIGEAETAWAGLEADREWSAALAERESPDPAFYREDSALLVAAPFSPAIKPFAPGDTPHKIYELRIYESPTERQLDYMHERFAGGEIEIFHKSGIHPVLYADTFIGPNMPSMAYLIPYESEAHREKAWAAFRENPDWAKLRDESIRRGGEIVRNITNMLLSPTSFSPLR